MPTHADMVKGNEEQMPKRHNVHGHNSLRSPSKRPKTRSNRCEVVYEEIEGKRTSA